jgi:ABC-type sugar transport system substrate-binding protein
VLVAEPDVDVIYVTVDGTAMGVLQALSEQDRLDDVTVTGFNGELTFADPTVAGLCWRQLS